MPERLRTLDRPLQFRATGSALHGVGAGWKLLAGLAIGGLGLALDGLLPLTALALTIMAGYRLARLPAGDLWRDGRWLVFQGAVVVGLMMAIRGVAAWSAGVRTALQLLLLFLPLALVLRTTPSEALLEPLRRRLPERLAFALGATLRFVPVFARELGELVEMQRLRGARLRARDLWRPGAWRDGMACVVLPMAVRVIEIAEAAAEAAEIRGVGRVGRVGGDGGASDETIPGCEAEGRRETR